MSFSGKSPSVNRVRYAPQSVDPVNPLEGDIFYSDGTSRAEGLWVRTNGAWTVLVQDNGVLNSLSLNKEILVPQSVDPSAPTNGTVFYSNGTPRAAGLWVRQNGAWVQISTGLRMVEFTTAGAHFFDFPAVINSAFIELVGGGGGGGSGAAFVSARAGGGGGRGGIVLRSIISDVAGSTANITVGAGGSGGAPVGAGGGNNGTAGGATSLTILGRTFTAPGGEGGNGGGAFGTGGAGASTDLSSTGLIRLGSGSGGNGSGGVVAQAGQPAPNNAITGALGGNGGNFPPGGTPGAGGGGGGGASASNGGNGGVAPSAGFPTVTSATNGNFPGGGGGGGNGTAAGFVDPLTFGGAGAVGRVRIYY